MSRRPEASGSSCFYAKFSRGQRVISLNENVGRTRCPIFFGCLPPQKMRRPNRRGLCPMMQQLYGMRKQPFPRCPMVRVSPCESVSRFSTHIQWAVPRICVRGRCIRHGGLRTKHRPPLPGHQFQPREKNTGLLQSTASRVSREDCKPHKCY